MEDSQKNNRTEKQIHINYKFIVIGLAIFVVISSIFIALALKSVPGDRLYTTKTTLVEPLALKLHLSNKSKTYYQVTLLKHRLSEIKELAKNEAVDDSQKAALSSNIDTHTATLESLVAASIDSSFPKTEVLFVLNDFASVAGAIEDIGENDPKLQSVGDTAENARSASVSLYKKRALSFVQTEAPTDVYAYIAEQLKIVRENLGKNEPSLELTRRVDNNLDKVDPALAKGDLTKVIVSIGEAYRFIAIDAYSGIITPEVLPAEANDINASTSETVISASTTEIKTEEVITQ